MSLSWRQRKTRLATLLNGNNQDDEDAEGVAIDRLMHGQNVIGKTGTSVYQCEQRDLSNERRSEDGGGRFLAIQR
jgi:hypothetical protein